MAKGSRKKKRQRRNRNILLVGLSLVIIIGIGIFTTEPAKESVVELFGQESEHLIFSATPQDLIGDFGESLSTLCKFRGILYYVTDTGERIQGGISFQKQFTPPFEAGSIVSQFTGKTITSFEQDVFLACKERQGADSKVQVIGGQFRYTVGATDFDGTEKLVFETFQVISGVSKTNPIRIPDSDSFPGTLITTIKVRALDIVDDLNKDELSFSSTIRFIQSYDVTLEITGTIEKFGGNLENRYKVDIVNNKGSATPKEPSTKSLDLRIIDPPSKVLVSGNVWTFEITMGDWDQSEGFPSITIQDSAKNIVFTKDVPLSGSNRDISIFADRFKFPLTKVGEYKISASVPAFREVAVDYIRVVDNNALVPNDPTPPKVSATGTIECLIGFTASNNKCIQNAFPTFIDPTQLGQILGVAINTLVPIVVGVIILVVIILIISAILKRTPIGRGIGGARTIIRLGSGGGNRSATNGRGGIKPNGALPRGFTRGREAV